MHGGMTPLQIYSRVVAAKPECAVPGLIFTGDIIPPIIIVRWLDLALSDPQVTEFSILPSWMEPGHERDTDPRTLVAHCGLLITTDRNKDHPIQSKRDDSHWGKTIFHALAEFHCPNSTKETP